MNFYAILHVILSLNYAVDFLDRAALMSIMAGLLLCWIFRIPQQHGSGFHSSGTWCSVTGYSAPHVQKNV